MTFYGEALGLDWANAVTGAVDAFGAPMHYLYRDADAQTVTAGDSFLAGIFNNAQQIVSGDEAVVSWVVETAAGSSGVLSFASGLDPTWNLTDPALASEDLGSRTVTGAQTIVLEQTGITTADILAEADQPALLVECVSGTVSIAQIRLRVWPPGGPMGAWAPGSAFARSGDHDVYAADKEVEPYGYPGPAEAWTAGRTEFDAAPATTWNVSGSPAILSNLRVYENIVDTNPDRWGSLFYRMMAYLQFQPQVVSTTTAGTAGAHPDRVPGDYGRSVQAVGGGPLFTEFVSWNGGLRSSTGDSGTVTLDPGELTLTPLGGTEFSGPVPFGLTGVAVTSDTLVPIPDEPYITVGAITPKWFTTQTVEEPSESLGVTLEGVSVNALAPDHEWWDPALPWVPERQPRFFVKDHDEVWRPVGFGKPASDLSLFHVWTPVGWYVECRDGETYTNAHPLKVKLYDGSWDTVAHMRPV